MENTPMINAQPCYWLKTGKYFNEYIEVNTHLDKLEFIPTLKGTPEKPYTADKILITALNQFYYRGYNDGDATCSDGPLFNSIACRLERHGLAKVRLNRHVTNVQLENIVDKVMEYLIPRYLKKQVTINLTCFVAIEVPRNFTNEDIVNLIRKSSTVDITIDKKTRNVDVVEISDVVDVDLINE